MLTKDFSYNLPEDLIAQNPADQRGTSRMLVLEKGCGISDTLFQKLPEYLQPGDLIVLNDTYKSSKELELELTQHVKSILTPFKYPRWYEFISELPKTSTGKIQRFKLRDKNE